MSSISEFFWMFKDSLCREFGRKRGQKKHKFMDYKLLLEFFQKYLIADERSAVKNSFSTYVCYTPDGLFWLNLYFKAPFFKFLEVNFMDSKYKHFMKMEKALKMALSSIEKSKKVKLQKNIIVLYRIWNALTFSGFNLIILAMHHITIDY